MPADQLPSFPSISTRPAIAPHSTFAPEHECLDPQLLGQSSIQATAGAVGNGPAASAVVGLLQMPDTVGGFKREDDDQEQIGAWSLGSL